jgi:hypothetical protein
MSTVWAQRREELLSDCIVSPDVFNQMVDRLAEFIVPYQGVLSLFRFMIICDMMRL